MGYYIEDEDKAAWLKKNANAVMADAPKTHKNGDDYAVCLVNNGVFFAAGICVDQHELEAFSDPLDGRRKLWFYVPKAVLISKCPRVERALS